MLLISAVIILSACGNKDATHDDEQSSEPTVVDTVKIEQTKEILTVEKVGHSMPMQDSTLDEVPDTAVQVTEMPKHNAPDQQSIDDMKAAKSKKKR